MAFCKASSPKLLFAAEDTLLGFPAAIPSLPFVLFFASALCCDEIESTMICFDTESRDDTAFLFESVEI